MSLSKEHGFRLHHVGYATKQIEPLTESYVARYGYQVSTPVIHDPFQTALVQFLKLEGGSGVSGIRCAGWTGKQAQQCRTSRRRAEPSLLHVRAIGAGYRFSGRERHAPDFAAYSWRGFQRAENLLACGR